MRSDMKNEIWKDFPLAPELYQASNMGGVKGKVKLVNGRRGTATRKEKIFSTKQSKHHRYFRVTLLIGGVRKHMSIHRIVAITFLPNPVDLSYINHINGDRYDNCVNNLEWCDHSHNIKHAYANGLMNTKGEKHPHSFITEKDVLEIREKRSRGISLGVLSAEYNTCRTNISGIANRRNWSHI